MFCLILVCSISPINKLNFLLTEVLYFLVILKTSLSNLLLPPKRKANSVSTSLREQKNIEQLFETNNKEVFGKAFNSLKNRCKNHSYLDFQAGRLFNLFTKLFYSDNENINDDIHKQMVNEGVNSYINECLSNYHEKEKVYVSKKLIGGCIDEMKPSNFFGWDGVNSNIIKNGKSNSLVYLIKLSINAIIYSGL